MDVPAVRLYALHRRLPDDASADPRSAARARRAHGAVPTAWVFVTVDPARDTREALAVYAAHFGDGLIAVGGATKAIKGFADQFRVRYAPRSPQPDAPQARSAGGYDIDHTASVALLGPDGKLHAIFTLPLSPERVADDVARMYATHSSPRCETAPAAAHDPNCRKGAVHDANQRRMGGGCDAAARGLQQQRRRRWACRRNLPKSARDQECQRRAAHYLQCRRGHVPGRRPNRHFSGLQRQVHPAGAAAPPRRYALSRSRQPLYRADEHPLPRAQRLAADQCRRNGVRQHLRDRRSGRAAQLPRGDSVVPQPWPLLVPHPPARTRRTAGDGRTVRRPRHRRRPRSVPAAPGNHREGDAVEGHPDHPAGHGAGQYRSERAVDPHGERAHQSHADDQARRDAVPANRQRWRRHLLPDQARRTQVLRAGARRQPALAVGRNG